MSPDGVIHLSFNSLYLKEQKYDKISQIANVYSTDYGKVVRMSTHESYAAIKPASPDELQQTLKYNDALWNVRPLPSAVQKDPSGHVSISNECWMADGERNSGHKVVYGYLGNVAVNRAAVEFYIEGGLMTLDTGVSLDRLKPLRGLLMGITLEGLSAQKHDLYGKLTGVAGVERPYDGRSTEVCSGLLRGFVTTHDYERNAAKVRAVDISPRDYRDGTNEVGVAGESVSLRGQLTPGKFVTVRVRDAGDNFFIVDPAYSESIYRDMVQINTPGEIGL